VILIIEQDEIERCFQNMNTYDDHMHYVQVMQKYLVSFDKYDQKSASYPQI